VRQSRLYRQHESGNDVKSILGTDHLRWDTEHQEGAYKGQKVFDHNKPNSVSNELRAKSNEMKGNINSNYANDWSTESGGSYKQQDSGRGYGQQPASMRDSYRSGGYDDGAVARTGNNKYQSNDYDQDDRQYNQYNNAAPQSNSARNSNGRSGGNQGGSSMGGQSLSQYQSEAYQAPAPNQQARGRVSGNSEGFQQAMNQPERSDRQESFQSSRGAPQRSNSRNNIYGGSEEVPSYNAHPAAVHRQQENQYNAPVGYGQGQTQGGQYGGSNYPTRATAPQGTYKPQYDYEDSGNYPVPGIAAEGSSNREGRSTRPW